MSVPARNLDLSPVRPAARRYVSGPDEAPRSPLWEKPCYAYTFPPKGSYSQPHSCDSLHSDHLDQPFFLTPPPSATGGGDTLTDAVAGTDPPTVAVKQQFTSGACPIPDCVLPHPHPVTPQHQLEALRQEQEHQKLLQQIKQRNENASTQTSFFKRKSSPSTVTNQFPASNIIAAPVSLPRNQHSRRPSPSPSAVSSQRRMRRFTSVRSPPPSPPSSLSRSSSSSSGFLYNMGRHRAQHLMAVFVACATFFVVILFTTGAFGHKIGEYKFYVQRQLLSCHDRSTA